MTMQTHADTATSPAAELPTPRASSVRLTGKGIAMVRALVGTYMTQTGNHLVICRLMEQLIENEYNRVFKGDKSKRSAGNAT